MISWTVTFVYVQQQWVNQILLLRHCATYYSIYCNTYKPSVFLSVACDLKKKNRFIFFVLVLFHQVPQLFTDNFDYQTRDDFVRGILVNEEVDLEAYFTYLLKRIITYTHELLMGFTKMMFSNYVCSIQKTMIAI